MSVPHKRKQNKRAREPQYENNNLCLALYVLYMHGIIGPEHASRYACRIEVAYG